MTMHPGSTQAVGHHQAAVSRARNLILVGALISFLLSVSLWFLGHKDEGLFVGIWVPSILSFGALLQGGGARP